MKNLHIQLALEQSAFALFTAAAFLTWGLPEALVVLGVDAFLVALAQQVEGGKND